MKVEFELTVDEKTGNPIIVFRSYDKNQSLEQRLLRAFIKKATKKGLEIGSPSGFLKSGTENSWENYEISIKKQR